MTENLLAYKELECDNIEIISSKIYQYLENKTDLLITKAEGWLFVDLKELMASVPELLEFFLKNKLAVRDASVVIFYDDTPFNLHVDELPVIAKINFPVINTDGWVNEWHSISQIDLDNAPKIINKFGATIEEVCNLPAEQFTSITRLHNMKTPIVFNSRKPHTVLKTTATKFPRIIASFTFLNQPIRWLM